jgi:hypothetical protein
LKFKNFPGRTADSRFNRKGNGEGKVRDKIGRGREKGKGKKGTWREGEAAIWTETKGRGLAEKGGKVVKGKMHPQDRGDRRSPSLSIILHITTFGTELIQ